MLCKWIGSSRIRVSGRRGEWGGWGGEYQFRIGPVAVDGCATRGSGILPSCFATFFLAILSSGEGTRRRGKRREGRGGGKDSRESDPVGIHFVFKILFFFTLLI